MSKINDLHTLAMDIAEEAFLAQRAKNTELAKQLAQKAYAYEQEAAMLLVDKYDIEPTRSVLFKSAACLAFDVENYRAAEKMIAFALSGNPPPEIAKELRNLMAEVNVYKNMVQNGVKEEAVIEQFKNLPINLKQEVADFVAFLAAKHAVPMS